MSPIRLNRLTNPRTILIALGICVGMLSLIAYVGFQARFLIEGPQLSLTTSLETVQHERYITVHGTARNSTRITLNGREIVTDETGAFAEPVVLEDGYSIVRVEAQDRYGRTSVLERAVVYAPSHNGTDVVLLPTESAF